MHVSSLAVKVPDSLVHCLWQNGNAYVKAIYRFAEANHIPQVHFKGEKKEKTARPYLETAARERKDPVVHHRCSPTPQHLQPLSAGRVEVGNLASLSFCRSVRPSHSILHNAAPSVRFQPSARYRHRKYKWEFCHIVQTSLRSWRSTRSRFPCSTRSRSELIGCSAILSRCESRWKRGVATS